MFRRLTTSTDRKAAAPPNLPKVFSKGRMRLLGFGLLGMTVVLPAFAEPAEILFQGGGATLSVDAEALEALSRTVRDDGLNEVQFRLSEKDTAEFSDMTRALEGQTLKISICRQVLASPTVMVPIEDGTVLISGSTDAGTTAFFVALETGADCPDPSG